MRKLSLHSWDEQDAFTGWRRVLSWQKGELKKIKRRYSRRRRRHDKAEIHDQMENP